MTSAAYRAVAFVVSLVAAAQTPSGSSTISGRVLNSLTGSPLPKATVLLELDKPVPSNAIALTDSQGRFSFQNLPAGAYRLHASRDGFMGLPFGTTRQGQAGTYVTVAAGEARSDLVFRLPPVGAISGIVRDSDGEPVPNVPIMLLRTMYRRGKAELQPAGGMGAASNDRGEYRLFNIMPGKYYLRAQPFEHRGMRTMVGPLHPRMQEWTEPIMAPVFYPNANDVSRATALEIRGGEEFEGIDFRLIASQPGTLIARPIVPEGIEPRPTVIFTLTSGILWNSMNQSFSHEGQGGAQDQPTQIRQIVPGEYTVRAHFDAPGGKKYSGSRTVTVQPGGAEEVAIEMRPGFDVPCAVKVEGPGAEKFRQFRLALTPPSNVYNAGPPPQTDWKEGAPCKWVNVLPGIWDININPLPPGMYIKSMTLGDQDVLNEEMTLEAQPSSPLTIVVSTASATLEAEVARSEDGKVQPSVVLLAPEERYRHVLSLYRFMYTDAKGKVEMKGLTPGSYRVFAFREVEPTSWQDPEFLKPYVEAGVPVRLVEGQNAIVKLKQIDKAATGETR